MKAHQRIIREQNKNKPSGFMFTSLDTVENPRIEFSECREIPISTASRVIMEYEWLGTMCNAPKYAFGIYFDNILAGVEVYSAVNPISVSSSIIGEEHADKVIQLSRGACVHWAHPHSASKLISYSLKEIEKFGYRVVVAYSDPDAGEIGTVYQSTNWLYCGLTEKRPEYYDARGEKITGPVGKVKPWMTRGPKTRKHRYIFILGNKSERRFFRRLLKWNVVSEYPKRAEELSEVTRDSTTVDSVVRSHDSALRIMEPCPS